MKKKLSKFICKELLYDYVSGVLDIQRQQQVESYVQEDPEVKAELEHLQLALKYTSQLKKITLSQPYHQELRDIYQKEGSTYYIKKAGFRSLQGVGVIVVLALLYLYFPAEQIINYFKRDPNKIVIAEIETTIRRGESINPNEIGEEEPESLLTQDDESQSQVAETSEGEEQEVKLSPEQEKKLREELEKQEAEQKMAAQSETQKPAQPVVSEPKKAEPKTNGFVYRAFITSDKRDEISDSLVQRIEALGGQKAGSVTIGWAKPNGTRYFHFTMTEANFEILKAFINNIMPVEIAKSPHPRVMPTGQVRMILEVQSP